MLMDDTIAAVATPVGQGGIGIVRLSGPGAREIAGRIFRPIHPGRELQARRLVLGRLTDPSTGAVLDEVLLSFMPAPFSYTREDVVEINSHSGFLLLSKILQVVIQAGARLAGPGEFTFRAFMNGRIDLTQAEAVVDLIRSRSERGLAIAAMQMGGSFRDEVARLSQKCMDILARIEAAIDFPEDVPEIIGKGEETLNSIEQDLLEPVRRLVAAHAQRRIWMEGIATVIVGRVNAGKSSILNRLLSEERALVTPIPGTTRDVIESNVDIEGIPLRLMDTAGFRKGRGQIENMGIRMTELRLSEADLVLLVLDQSRSLAKEDFELLSRTKGKKAIVILNKSDLPSRIGRKTETATLQGCRAVKTSALKGFGIDELRRAIADIILSDGGGADLQSPAPNQRQRRALVEASDCFAKAQESLKRRMPLEIVAADLQTALDSLGEIAGKSTSQDVIERIFEEFCIGK